MKKKPATGIGKRPAVDAAAWVKQGHRAGESQSLLKSTVLTARLTIDVTPAQRSQLKIIAIERGLSVSELLRQLLEREFFAGKARR